MEKMKINEAIKKLIKDRNFTYAYMGEFIGLSNGSKVMQRLANDNMTFDRAIEMLDVLGYEVTVQPKRAGARPSGQIVIMGSTKKEEKSEG